MIKKTLLFVFYILTIYTVKSQEINIGLKGGINYNNIGDLFHLGTASGGGLNVTPIDDYNYKANGKIGLTFGLFAKINFNKFYIQTEINTTKLNNSYPLALKTSNWKAKTINIPLLFGYRFFRPASIYLGANYKMNNEIVLEGVESPILFEKSVIGINAGFQLDFDLAIVDLRYTYGITQEKSQRVDIVRATYGTNVAYLDSYNPSQIELTISIPLISFNKPERRRSKTKWHAHNCLY
ncbi:MAG: outer membrane beta-barrel protein [Lutibacter sp.]|uniref:outer membrane beta-barrel protein n=1 Tax=Lutibacter sp. TaxID=1925666 RepID=UPI00299EA647|nr:outer membrane beta-barrel protein [Lutibacter sp.]MDX1828110.1 outer membrane beta-barrel protein [Lutibacter sp.]